MASSLFAKVAFYPTVGYTLFMAQVSSRKCYNRIDDTVILGALPFRWVLKELMTKENVRALVSVTEDFEMDTFLVPKTKEMELDGLEQLQLKTVDYVGTPSQENIQKAVAFIQYQKDKKHSVYVHCKAGRTRSATVVACYLIQVNGWTPEEAVDFIKTKRAHIWIREKQWSSIRNFYDNLLQQQTVS